jgi:hypothetical protein
MLGLKKKVGCLASGNSLLSTSSAGYSMLPESERSYAKSRFSIQVIVSHCLNNRGIDWNNRGYLITIPAQDLFPPYPRNAISVRTSPRVSLISHFSRTLTTPSACTHVRGRQDSIMYECQAAMYLIVSQNYEISAVQKRWMLKVNREQQWANSEYTWNW